MSSIPTAEAARLRKKFGGNDLPVPVDQIARMAGIRIESLSLDDNLSGMSFVKDGVAVIVVNSNHHLNRRRFTIAHELGHHILHREYLTNNVHVDKFVQAVLPRNRFSSEGVDSKEIEANSFAAELLMPESELARWGNVDINDDVRVQVLAKKLKVSVAALTYRLINLGQAA